MNAWWTTEKTRTLALTLLDDGTKLTGLALGSLEDRSRKCPEEGTSFLAACKIYSKFK
jgi:hypothetical protein